MQIDSNRPSPPSDRAQVGARHQSVGGLHRRRDAINRVSTFIPLVSNP
ncbi:hypothetical protein [Phormidium sp. CCY1219]|nr:hypothetical protein [Phormidium sp. CCY1219]MEB3827476.1 hypothetical protein [Phormidium sp. CCY1219]